MPRLFARAFAFFLFVSSLSAQSIFTVAGGAPIGDGGPATAALLQQPWDSAIDAAGNIYFSDQKNHRVRRIDAKSGIITTFAGGGTSGRGDGGPAVEAEVPDPAGLAFDSEGNLYIGSAVLLTGANAGRGIRRVAPDGIITTYANLDFAPGLAVDRDGNLYVPRGTQVHKVDRSGIVTVVAGGGTAGFSGDGGPATAAQLGNPNDVAFDSKGNLYIADRENGRVRRVDVATQFITTVVGNGIRNEQFRSGSLATETNIGLPESIAFDKDDNLFIGGTLAGSGIIRVDARTGIATHAIVFPLAAGRGLSFDSSGNLFATVTSTPGLVQKIPPTFDRLITIAGVTQPRDENMPAVSTHLFVPYEVLVLSAGDLLFTDFGSARIRKVDISSGRINTIAGAADYPGIGPPSPDGTPALEARILPPLGIARDVAGNIYFSVSSHHVRKLDAATNTISWYAGTFPFGDASGDGGPARQAAIASPRGLACDANGDLYIAESGRHRIRKVDVRTGIITTIAGVVPEVASPEGGFSGDGGPASQARLNVPRDVVFDKAGNLYISDGKNGRIRKIDRNGIITTIAGSPSATANEGPALQVRLTEVQGLHSDDDGNLWITLAPGEVRYFDARSGRISIVAGSGRYTYSGDGGPARTAGLNTTTGIAVDGRGTVYIADSSNNRIRAVHACVEIKPPSPVAPQDAAGSVATSPALMWEKVDGAFRYDVYLSTTTPPNMKVASDITETSFTPANLLPSETYYWSIVARGDPYCPKVSAASSAVRSFTTVALCEPPGSFALRAPDDLLQVATPLELAWQGASGAGSYDVLLGTTNPPPLAGTTASTSLIVPLLVPGTTYYWSVIARSACDSSKTTTTAVRSFRTPGDCPTPGAFTQSTPANGEANVATTMLLSWSPSPGATNYDLYLGTANPPPLFLPAATSTQFRIASLTPGATYSWRVVARAGCDPARTTSTPVGTFTVSGACVAPDAVPFAFVPSGSVATGQTYVVTWRPASKLAPGGHYLVERSTDPAFATIVDSQQTPALSATFIATSTGRFYHRVRAVNACTTGSGTATVSNAMNVIAAPPNIVFTVQPEAVLTTLGQNLEDKRARFVIENIGNSATTVIIGRQEIDSLPFFSVRDPLGSDSTFVTLEPRKPREFEIRFSGPPNDKPASYQGIVFLAAIAKPLPATPYAFVSLRVGGGEAATPQFRRNGSPTEYAFFPGFEGDDATRDPISVEIHNPGTTPMELGVEIGPEIWLVAESDWNATAIPPGATRSVKLYTRRARAPHESALPRYTYFTVRTKSGLSARLLVQDNEREPTANGRGSALDPSLQSLIIPEVVSADERTFSTVRISNIGSDPVDASLFFTPAGADGFDEMRVRRATVTVPPNDVVTLTDPLAQLWGLARPMKGAMEVRAVPEKLGLISVSSLSAHAADEGGVFTISMPTVARNEGARSSGAHAISGITTDANIRALLTLAETGGLDKASVRLTLFDSGGTQIGERTVEVLRFGSVTVDDLIPSGVSASRLELRVTSGAGSVIAVLKLLDAARAAGATWASRPLLTTAAQASKAGAKAEAKFTYFIPLVASGAVADGSAQQFQTAVGFGALVNATQFTLTYRDAAGTSKVMTTSLAARRTIEYRNVLQEAFTVSSGTGSLLIESDGPADVYARLTTAGTGVQRATLWQAVPVISNESELITSGDAPRPLFVEGLDQSIDPKRGNDWSLFLSEIGGKAGTVALRLYEAGNRTTPIAEYEIPISPRVTIKLENLFSAFGLTTPSRQKDRTNMLLSMIMKSGGGTAAAMALAIDKKTGNSRTVVLSSGSVAVPSIEVATPVIPPPPPRRRASR